MQSFVVAGGCFWCLDAAYRVFEGVIDVVSGYAGGEVVQPSYEQVCTGRTGHAEVVKVIFDETKIPADVILDAFFSMHDPTQLNRQGADVGTQYRSAMFYQDEYTREIFAQAIQKANQLWGGGVVTRLEPLTDFYAAEDYHQNFFAKNPSQAYCLQVASTKVTKMRQSFQEYIKPI